DSAYARQHSDWLVGINATRAQTIQAQSAGYDGVYSLGRVQTPTLALIVARDREIANFKPQTYFEVVADFQSTAGNYRGLWFNANGSRFDDRAKADAIVQKVHGKPGLIEKVDKKTFREKAPQLYDLTSLQRAANARYAFSAQKTLELAQSLYEKKFITYPRTSSRHLSSDVMKEIRRHLEATNIGPYAPFVAQILNQSRLTLTSRHVDDKKVTDHHAIIPTTQKVDGSSLAIDEKRIYDLIARRFIAAFFDDAELERTTIITVVEGERFITKGTIIVKPGWRQVDPPGREEKKGDDDDETAELPEVRAQDRVKVLKAETLTKQTKAPPRYSEASLLAAMETAGKAVEDDELRQAMKDSGLGTPATRAAIIEGLLKRGYIERDKKSLKATEKGISLINLLKVDLLKSPELTGQWEKKLTDMVHGKYSREKFMSEVTDMVRQMVGQIYQTQMQRNTTPSAPITANVTRPENAISCPKCALQRRTGHLVERKSDKGKFLSCSLGKEGCGYISDVPKNAAQRKALLSAKCPNCQGAMRLRLPKEKEQRAVLLCLNYQSCKGVLRFDEKGKTESTAAKIETGPPCIKCGASTIKRGPFKSKSGLSYFWGCSNWKKDGSGCDAAPVWINNK
ncbi:MAG: DNA topoisomerase, partial [Acidobacteriota bacterium]